MNAQCWLLVQFTCDELEVVVFEFEFEFEVSLEAAVLV